MAAKRSGSTQGGEVSTEQSYPYVSGTAAVHTAVHPCGTWMGHVGAMVSDTVQPPADDDHLATWLTMNRPVAVVVTVELAFGHVDTVLSCSRNANPSWHALLIGYGTDQAQGDYWLLKHTWGEASWGEQGYYRMQRGGGWSCMVPERHIAPSVNCQVQHGPSHHCPRVGATAPNGLQWVKAARAAHLGAEIDAVRGMVVTGAQVSAAANMHAPQQWLITECGSPMLARGARQ
eukprot:gene57887-biopygen40525